MREALFSQDGWGCQHVNQDTNWEVPSSPEPANKDPSGPPMWKPNINNGTDLWESNLRNGGQPPAQQVPKPSWGHTPSSNLGGTWGEDDDGVDSTSVWTGQSGNSAASGPSVSANPAAVGAGVGGSSGPQWGQGVGVGVGIGATGNSSTAGTGALPVAQGCASGGNNLPAPGAVGGPGSNVVNANNGWGDPRELRPLGGTGPMDLRNVDPRDSMPMRGVGAPTGDPRDLRMIDPRDPIRGDPRGISGRLNGTSEMWGHHPQIGHNQIQNLNKMVGPAGVGASGTNVPNSNIGPGGINVGVGGVSTNMGSQWGGAQAVVGSSQKDMAKQISGWEEPSPPPQRRNIPNYDDGTSLWGQQTRVPGGGAHWKDMTDSMSRNHLMRSQNPTSGNIVGNSNVAVGGGNTNVVGPQTRLVTSIGPNGVAGGQLGKPDAGAIWVHPNSGNSGGNGGRNPGVVSSWGDDSHSVVNVTGNNWIDDKTNSSLAQISGNSNSWSDSPATAASASGASGGWGTKQPKLSTTNSVSGWSNASTVGGSGDGDISSDWSHGGIVGKVQQQQQQQQKLSGINVGVVNSDMIKQSKQYRILVENGFKKDDVERALLSANMNIEEAAELLRANANAMEGWRRHDDTLGSYTDHTNSSNSSGFPQRYPVANAPSMSFPPSNLMSSMSGSTVPGSNNPNIAALQVQKYLSQGGLHGVALGGPQSVNVNTANAASVAFCQNSSNATPTVNIAATNANNQPSGQHIRMLGQQIQLAIHSGFISSQILTQPLTQNTLNLLNQLLGLIKHLQAAQQSLSRSNANPMAVNVAIAKYKQQIQNVQNQINAQQSVYVKQQNLQQQNPQQQQPHHPSGHLNNSSNDYLRNHEAISTLQGNFSELNLNKPTGYQGAPNQQSRLNQWKLPVLEKDTMTADSTDFSRAPGATKQNLSSNSNNMSGPLGLQNDGTWSTGRNIGDGWPDPSSENESKDWSVTPTATAYTDLVQEFEPGKPWKGSQIKTIEDDPSITPGSVARSPLSINPTPKDADIFANTGKSSPTDLPALSLSSSTWSFNPNQNFPSWSDNTQQCATSELWTSPLNKSSSRGPPPGLSTNKSGSGLTVTTPSATVSGNSNGWLPNRAVPSTNTTWTGGNNSWGSNWLLLKNLNAQIDGPTLRTLCMQHGPLVSFHLYLIQGIALCKYASREEANKAQMALNNCVLGNTTMFAESPNENEVQSILQHLPPQGGPSSSNNSTITITSSGNTAGNNSCIVATTTVLTTGSGSSGSCNPSSGQNSVAASGTTSNQQTATAIGNTNAPAISVGGSNAVSGGASNSSSNSSCTSGNSGSIVGSSVNGSAATSNANNAAKNTSNVGGATNITSMTVISQPNVNVSSNVSTAVSNTNSAWRQTTQNPSTALQGQNRPQAGREAEYDYISQFVCSIVDD
ncbi:protein Gawky isoform X1 [Drosophila busckii]|uniref:protein Gawky isoform X1 n=1 Tax=Drosophila busckii TaxID=30019 RepID=UPI00083F1A85|nr:protein Gawky isoform X1 [Drosophila busckii]